jgi:flagellar basal-body rod protein FlgG
LAGSSSSQTTKNPNGIHLGHGVKHVSTEKIFTQGNLKHTGNELDLSIDGDGFFQVLKPDGSIAYSRNGSWKKDADGKIVTDDGYSLEPEIIVPPEATKIMIGEDGTVEVLIGTDRTPTKIGNLQLARFVNTSGLTPTGKSLFIETSASGAPSVGEPGQNSMGNLSQGFIESSNVSVVDEMVNMITAQRAYEVNSKSIQTSDNMLQTAVNIIR